jgi:hypothetical protein
MLTTTVVIPTYNRAHYLRDCLRSILAQSRPPDEILVVDDGSTDETEATVRSHAPAARYLRQENAGKSAALNRALEHVSGSHVWIMDDDDIACADALETLAGLLERDRDADFAYGRHVRFTDDPNSGERTFLGTGYWRDCDPSDLLVATLEDFFAHQPGMLVSRDLYRRAGPFDTELKRSQDYKMMIALARHGRGVSTPRTIFLQRQHRGARGPAGATFAASEADARWVEADRRIFSEVHREFGLAEYLPERPTPLSPRDMRHALLTRASIMARKRLWSEAIDDFRSAAALGLGPLDRGETDVLRRAFGSKFGAGDLQNDAEFRSLLAEPTAPKPDMRRIKATLAMGLRWRVREALSRGRLREALGYASVMTRLRLSRA